MAASLFLHFENEKILRGMGFEPMRCETTDLETVSLTTRTSTLATFTKRR